MSSIPQVRENSEVGYSLVRLTTSNRTAALASVKAVDVTPLCYPYVVDISTLLVL